MFARCIIAALLLAAATAQVTACVNDTLCQSCQNNQCVICAYGFPNANGTCTAASSISGCYSYLSSSSCYVCNPGYLQTGNTACTALNSTFGAICAFAWTNATYCNQCRNGGLWSNATNTCDATQKCSDPNCSQCYLSNGAMVCGQCKSGYAIFSSNGIGNTCIASTAGCRSTNSTNTCLYCNAGYYYNNGTCVANSALNYKDTASASLLKVWTAIAAGLLLLSARF